MAPPPPTIPVRPPGQIHPYPAATHTGKVPFSFPATGLKGETAWQLWGELPSSSSSSTSSSSPIPLVILHGGPGATHNYLRPYARLHAKFARPVLMYDQIGCGDSSHFREKKGDESFWTIELFVAELENLLGALGIAEYDLLGHSWGGVLGAEVAIRKGKTETEGGGRRGEEERKGKGLRKLILADSMPSMKLWVQAAERLRGDLPDEVREALDRCEREGNTHGQEYEEACEYFYKLHMCRLEAWPPELMKSFELLNEDNTVYETMNGPSEFFIVGSLKSWDVVKDLHLITHRTCPGGVLLVNGYYDEAQDEVVDAFFQNISAKVKWARFALSSHTPHLEETEKVMETVKSFLKS